MSDIFADINLPRITQKASDGQEELTIAIYNGRLGFTIFGPPGKPATWRESIGMDFAVLLEQLLKNVLAGQPGFKVPLIFQKFDPATKKNNVTSTLIIGKDEKQICYIEVQFQSNGSNRTVRFNLKSPGTITTGESFNDAARSANRVRTLIYMINNILPVAGVLSDKKQERPAGGGGGYNRGGGGGGYNKGSGHSAPQSSASDFGSDSGSF